MQFLDAKINPPPKDGTLLLLVVKVIDEDNWNPTEDSRVFRTIGFNSLGDTGEDRWQCAGWCWCCDEFTNTSGEVLAWANIPETPNNLLSHD